MASVMISDTKSVNEWNASAVKLHSPSASASRYLLLLPLFEPLLVLTAGHAYAFELKTYPPAPFAMAIPRLTYKPILVMRTPGSFLFLLVRYALSPWWWWWW